MMKRLSHNALKGLKNTDGGVSPRLRMVFCFNNIRRLNQQYYRLNSGNSSNS